MLILTRRVGETVMIGNDVTVTVLGVKGNQVASASMRRATWPFTAKKFSSASSANTKKAHPRRVRRRTATRTTPAL